MRIDILATISRNGSAITLHFKNIGFKMALWSVLLLALFFVITMILLTLLLHYYKQAFDCDSQTSFWCFTDWKCDAGMTDSTGNVVSIDNMECYLYSLYGVENDNCTNANVRDNPCLPEDTVDTTNPNLCSDGSLVTSPVDGNPFSCYCQMGNNISVGYTPGDPASTTGPINVNQYGCKIFDVLNSDSICPPTS